MQMKYFRNPAHFFTASCLMLALTGCGGDDGDNSGAQGDSARGFTNSEASAASPDTGDAANVQPATVVQVAVEDGRFTTLVAALQATGLDAVLSDTASTYTVFAPTDSAFALLPEGTLAALLAPEGLPVLSDILLYHVISGLPDAVPADVAVNLAMQGAPANQITMANGDTLALTLDSMMQTLLVNDARVIITDIATDNGIIHVLDAVLSPPEAMDAMLMENNLSTQAPDEMPMEPVMAPICDVDPNPDPRSVFEAISAEADLTILTDLLVQTGLNEVLRNVFADARYTIFAPTDEAFGVFVASLGPEIANRFALEGVDALMDSVGVDGLTSLLLYHVLGIAADADTALGLAVSENKRDRILVTLNGDALQLSSPDQQRIFANMAEVTCTDLAAKNGVVHKVNAVISFPDNVDVVHAVALKPELSTFYNLIKLTDLDHLLRASREVTVLAPTNDAFAQIPQETLDYLLSEVGRSDLIQILKQHVVIQQQITGDVAIPAATAFNANGLAVATAADGVSLTVRVNGDALTIGGAAVVDADIFAENGIIHGISSVIVTPH